MDRAEALKKAGDYLVKTGLFSDIVPSACGHERPCETTMDLVCLGTRGLRAESCPRHSGPTAVIAVLASGTTGAYAAP